MQESRQWNIAAAWGEWLSRNSLSYSEVARMFSAVDGENVSAAQVRNMTLTEGWGVRYLHKIKKAFPELNTEWLVTGQGKPVLAKSEQSAGIMPEESLLSAEGRKNDKTLLEQQLKKEKIKYQRLAEEHMELLRKYAGQMEHAKVAKDEDKLKELVDRLEKQSKIWKMILDNVQYQ